MNSASLIYFEAEILEVKSNLSYGKGCQKILITYFLFVSLDYHPGLVRVLSLNQGNCCPSIRLCLPWYLPLPCCFGLKNLNDSDSLIANLSATQNADFRLV